MIQTVTACDRCHLDNHEKEHPRILRLVVPFLGVDGDSDRYDFCSWKCLIAFAKARERRDK